MNLFGVQGRSFLARCLYKFFIDGTLKSYGVLLEYTAKDITKYHFIAGWMFTLQIGACYLSSPLAGVLQGSFNRPLLGFLGGLCVGLGNITFALMSSSISTWQMLLLLTISGVGFGLLNIVTVLSLKDAFGQSYALVYSTSLLASNIGISVMPLLLESLLRHFKMHTAMTIFSSVSCTLVLISILLLPGHNKDSEKFPTETSYDIRNKKVKNYDMQQQDEFPSALEGKVAKNKTLLSQFNLVFLIKSHPDVFILLPLSASYDYIYSSWSIFLVPFGEYLGIKSDIAVWLSTVSGLSGFAGRLVCIFIYYWSNINPFTGFTLPYLLVTCGCFVAVYSESFLWLAVASSLGGFGVSVLGNATSTVTPAYVCDQHFQVTVILLYTTSGVITQFGGIVTGAIVDVSGSYRIAFAVLVVISVLQVILSLCWFCSSFSTKSRPADCKPLLDN